MDNKEPLSTNQKNIDFLQTMHGVISAWKKTYLFHPNKETFKSSINRNLLAVKTLVQNAGAAKLLKYQNSEIDPFDNIFLADNISDHVLNMIEQAIGFYGHLEASSGLFTTFNEKPLRISSSITRALRIGFRKIQPASEAEVQDIVEVILAALDIKYLREKEVVCVGERTFRPDFTVPDLELAIEVKLSRANHGSSKIQEEVAADVSAYKTKWKSVLVIIYDNGTIANPERIISDNREKFGIQTIIIKH